MIKSKGEFVMSINEVTTTFDTFSNTIKEQFLSYLKGFQIYSLQEFYEAISHMPMEIRNVLLARWGLDGREFCLSFRSLNKKLDLTNSKLIYLQAEQLLGEYKLKKFFKPNDSLYEEQITYGHLIFDIFSDLPNVKVLFGKIDLGAFKQLLYTLPITQFAVVERLYGINAPKEDIKVLSMYLKCSPKEILSIRTNAFSFLRRKCTHLLT